LNKQGKIIQNNGIPQVVGGIEWVKSRFPDGSEAQGSTSNPVRGCLHRCQWLMPDGSVATCYAKEVAEGVAQKFYPQGFEAHYWNPDELKKWESTRQPQRIFWDSMADLFGHWVPKEQIETVLAAAGRANWHTFQSLTKNPSRMLKFELPGNVWPGASMPPDFMWGKHLERRVQERMLHKSLVVLARLAAQGLTTWMSFEPLSWDVAWLVKRYPKALKWAVIGAASNGAVKYQPDPRHVENVLDVLDQQGIPVFFKGNLIWSPWREEFPK
jgi:protein gp37